MRRTGCNNNNSFPFKVLYFSFDPTLYMNSGSTYSAIAIMCIVWALVSANH